MNEQQQASAGITIQALQRMPYYLQYLKGLHEYGAEIVAAPAAAKALHLNDVQVRKDFAAVSTNKGKPKAGFSITELINNMEELLGYHNINDAVLVGVGSLGKALISYKGFNDYGLHIVAAFDAEDTIIGTEISGKKILPTEKLSEICRRMNIHIGIITVPQKQAQIVCDQLVAGGVLAIWNFAQTHLSAPKNILIQNENMAASLAILSKHLQEKLNKQ